MLELKNVSKQFKNNLLFENINLKLEKGHIYGLVGENGSGKSTLIKMILNLSKYNGNIVINGKNIRKDYKTVMNNISAVVDSISLYDFLSAEENLRYFSLLYQTDVKRVYEVLDLVKLNNDKKIVKNFSLGMKQRLSIAISLLKNPDIIILDEPTNGLDPKGIRDLRNLLISLKNKTIIISSHMISEIQKISSDILFIHNKKIESFSVKEQDKNDLEDTLISMMENYHA